MKFLGDFGEFWETDYSRRGKALDRGGRLFNFFPKSWPDVIIFTTT